MKTLYVCALLLQIQYLGVYKGGLNMETIAIGEFPVYGALIMLIVDCLLYSLIAVYFSLVIEGWFVNSAVFTARQHSLLC